MNNSQGNDEKEEIDVRLFESLSNLKYLYMNNNKLKRIDRKCFEPLKSIELIYLYNNVDQNVLSFVKPYSKIWYYPEVQEIVKKYKSIARWNRFL